MRFRTSSRLRSATVSLALFVAALPVGEWTLCLGASGHLALETADAACAEPPAEHRDADIAPCSDCDDCRDVSLQVARGVWRLDTAAVRTDAVNALAFDLPAPSIVVCRHADQAIACPPEPRSTRTPILRC